MLAIVFGAAWLAARLFAERFTAIQWAAWVGVEWAFVVVLVLVAIAWMIRGRPKRSRRGSLSLLRLEPHWLAVLVLMALGGKTALDWNLPRLAISALHQRVPAEDDLRVASINLSGERVDRWPSLEASGNDKVEVLVVANRRWNADLQPAWEWVRSPPEQRDAAIIGRCAVMSRLPIRRYAQAWVNFDDVWPQDQQPESGWAAWFELEPPSPETAPIVVWVLDLPSPIGVSRKLAVERTLEAIDAWTGIAYTIDANHQRSSVSGVRFPQPDVVLGDFNTPRWSHALRPLTDGFRLREVSSSVGIGPSNTFPSPRSWWPIDLLYVSDSWKPEAHSTVVVEGLRHRAVTMTISPAKQKRTTSNDRD